MILYYLKLKNASDKKQLSPENIAQDTENIPHRNFTPQGI